MSHLGGASLESPADESDASASDNLEATLAAVSDDTDIERTISCSDSGIQYEPDEGETQTIETSAEAMLAVTRKAAYVLPAGIGTDPEAIETMPLTAIDDAQSSGLVRRKLTITTEEGTYRISVDGRPDLEGTAQFLRRASWSWRRVAPRLATARSAITELEDHLDDRGPEQLERDKHQAKMALSKAQSGAGRLEVAVDAIEAEIEHLRERLQRQRIRWHVLQGEDDAERATAKLSAGLVHGARPLFESARDHFEQALTIARETDGTRSKQIRIRLEEIREQVYDIEVEPVSDAHDAVEQALATEDHESAIEHWRAAHEQYEDALEDAADDAPIRFQLTWIDANLVRAHRAYAAELEADADEHASNGHEQWARQLYIAASDELLDAGEIAQARSHVDVDPIKAQYEQLATTHTEDSAEWIASESAGD